MKRVALSAIALIALVSRLPAQESVANIIEESAKRLAKVYYRPLNVTELIRAANVKSTKDADTAMRAMIANLNDPDSEYFSPIRVQDIDTHVHYQTGWIRNAVGVVLEEVPGDEFLRVLRPVIGGRLIALGSALVIG